MASTTPENAAKYVGVTSQFVPVDWEPITPGPATLARPYRAIRASDECEIEVKMAGSGGATRTLKFMAGETRYGMFLAVESVGAGSAEGAV
jgi:hypothetical protein